MSDFDKLHAQFNIKNVDAAQLTKALSEHQNTLIKVGLGVASLIMIGVMFNDYHTKDQAVRTKMSQVQEKLEAIKARDGAIQKLADFKSSLPKKFNEFELITLISNYAKIYNGTITSLSPAESKDMGLYDVLKVTFDVTTIDFKGMMLLLRKIEASKLPLRIDSWSGHEEEDGRVSINLQISAVFIHP